ncbi:MAG: hypothetical protein QOJ52_1708, partial [Acidimicrobiaceae bacterium]|nr:hypothetical protein [Acidimicrobiaceae bacterium]
MNISGNNLTDNWGGVTLWENADRFCGSPANTSATFCTMGNPTAANFNTCVAGTINNAPYFADCRWKTQNVAVHDNTMAFSRANVGCAASTGGCGVQAVISNYGTTPSWSPYLGNTVMNTIATQQNNHFANNTYTGDWTFAAGGAAALNFSSWQGSSYGQDPGSTFNGASGGVTANNLLDADTSGLEASIGHWIPWFSAGVAQNATQAQSGTHSLQVNITAPYGWGVQINNWPGFTASPGPATVNFWAMTMTPGLNATMAVQWRDGAGNVLASSTAVASGLTATWQQATANVTAPAGTASATVTFTGTNGVAGNAVYLDQIAVLTGSGAATTPPPTQQANLLDADSSTLEGSAGRWTPWFSSSVAQSTTKAQSGTHSAQVNITAPYGWGVQLSNWPGFAAAPGPQTMSFWGLLGSGNLGVTMQAQWRDASGNVLGTTSATVSTLNGTWQQASATDTAPAGTAFVSVTFTAPNGGAGVAGNTLFLDQIVVGPPASVGVNLLDADTAGAEGSSGRWVPWFSDSVAQATTQAQNGTHSLQVAITAPYGWGIQLSNWPGFAATPGPKSVSFWAMASTAGLNATMQVQWRDTSGTVLATTSAALANLTGTWQQSTISATAPAGTAYASATVTGTNGVAGNSVYLDQIYVGS